MNRPYTIRVWTIFFKQILPYLVRQLETYFSRISKCNMLWPLHNSLLAVHLQELKLLPIFFSTHFRNARNCITRGYFYYLIKYFTNWMWRYLTINFLALIFFSLTPKFQAFRNTQSLSSQYGYTNTVLNIYLFIKASNIFPPKPFFTLARL